MSRFTEIMKTSWKYVLRIYWFLYYEYSKIGINFFPTRKVGLSDFIMQIFISLSWTDTKYLYFKNSNIRRVFVRMHSDNSVCFVNVVFTHDRD
jgi:hypothetical protein